MLSDDGHVSEGSGENVIIIRHGRLITPERSDNVLEGITPASVMQLARDELGLEIDRALDRPQRALRRRRGVPHRHRGAHHRRWSSSTVARSAAARSARSRRSCRTLFFDCLLGRYEKYADWVTAVKPGRGARKSQSLMEFRPPRTVGTLLGSGLAAWCFVATTALVVRGVTQDVALWRRRPLRRSRRSSSSSACSSPTGRTASARCASS